MENNFGFFCQAESKVNGRSVWRYLCATPIGNINIVEYEQGGQHMGEIIRFLFDENLEAAERKYAQIVKGIVSGKL